MIEQASPDQFHGKTERFQLVSTFKIMTEQRSLPKPLRICGTELLRLLRVLKAMQHMKFYQRTCTIAAWFNTLGPASLCAFAGLSPSQALSNQDVLQALITRSIATIEVGRLLTTCREAWHPHILPTQVTESHLQTLQPHGRCSY